MSGKQAKRQRQALQAEVDEAMPVVVKYIRGAVDKLRHEYARRSRVIRRHDPEGAAMLKSAITPCETCAFRRTADFTDGDTAFLHTSCELVAALALDRPFLCHEPKEPGDAEYRPSQFPCIGWLTLQSPIPGRFDIRELVGDETVNLMVEGRRVFAESSKA